MHFSNTLVLRLLSGAAAAGFALALASPASAEMINPAKAKITDGEMAQSLTGKPGNAKEGRKLFVARKLGNCLACHANKDLADQPFHGEIGPAVDGVASRYTPAQLRAIVVNSKAVFGPATVMPGFYVTDPAPRVADKFKGKTILSAEQVEDVVAYLETLKQ